tara:strand:- start:391 stop:549 length:159 start_codon:yes stop_codon:yes gene_type:complete
MVEAIILKLCLNEMQFEEYKEQHFSSHAVYATYDPEPEDPDNPCFYIRIEKW